MIDNAKGKKHRRKRKGGKVLPSNHGHVPVFQRQEYRPFQGTIHVAGMVCRSTETCYSATVFACFFPFPPQPSSGPSTVNNRHTPSPWHRHRRPRAVPPTCKAPPLISRSVQIYYCIDPIPFSTSNPLPLLLFPEYPRFTF